MLFSIMCSRASRALPTGIVRQEEGSEKKQPSLSKDRSSRSAFERPVGTQRNVKGDRLTSLA